MLHSAWIAGGSLTDAFYRYAHVAVAGYRPAHAPPAPVAEYGEGSSGDDRGEDMDQDLQEEDEGEEGGAHW